MKTVVSKQLLKTLHNEVATSKKIQIGQAYFMVDANGSISVGNANASIVITAEGEVKINGISDIHVNAGRNVYINTEKHCDGSNH